MKAWRRRGGRGTESVRCPAMVWDSLATDSGTLGWTFDPPLPTSWTVQFRSRTPEGSYTEDWTEFTESPLAGDGLSCLTAWAITEGFFVQARMRGDEGPWCYGPEGEIPGA